MRWAEVCGRRLAAHSLVTPAPADELVDVVRAVCGVHAQVPAAAELSIGVRVRGVTREDVRAALWQRRSLVRTYGPRGTVHLLPADELGWWLAALSAARPPDRPGAPGTGMDDEQLAAVLAAITDALAGGEQLTWRELGDRVVALAGAWAGEEVFPAFGELWPRWRPAISTAAARGLLCFGPPRGNQATYVRTDHWLGGVPAAPDGDAALRQLALRYLTGYGPATPADFAQWLAMPSDAAAVVFAALDLQAADVEGRAAWLPRGAAPASEVPATGASTVRLLPHFDAYLVGCHPRSAVFPGPAAERALHRGAAGQVPVLLVDGVAAGVWQHRRAGRRVALTVEPFVPLSGPQLAELERQARRLGEVMQAAPSLSVAEVAARPHL